MVVASCSDFPEKGHPVGLQNLRKPCASLLQAFAVEQAADLTQDYPIVFREALPRQIHPSRQLGNGVMQSARAVLNFEQFGSLLEYLNGWVDHRKDCAPGCSR